MVRLLYLSRPQAYVTWPFRPSRAQGFCPVLHVAYRSPIYVHLCPTLHLTCYYGLSARFAAVAAIQARQEALIPLIANEYCGLQVCASWPQSLPGTQPCSDAHVMPPQHVLVPALTTPKYGNGSCFIFDR